MDASLLGSRLQRLRLLLRALGALLLSGVVSTALYKVLRGKTKQIEDNSQYVVEEHSYLRQDWQEKSVDKQAKKRAEVSEITHFGLPDDLFELGTKLDAGGQGTVFVCVRKSTHHEYAVKVISTGCLEKSERQLASLRKEIRIMRELHHPNIVNLHEAFWTDDQCLIVMDLARGGNLFDKLHDDIVNCRSDPFPGLGDKEFASKYVAGQLLEGIGYMQAHHVLHRDLKLENILITTTSFSAEEHCPLHHIKIADFGLSTSKEKKASSKPALRRTMTAVGTPDYVAPEVLLGKYDERVDYWSFGVILYAILCGRMPFFVSCLSPDEHKEQVSQVNSCPSWKRVSREGRNFVQGLLTVDPELRMDFSQCSEHPWLVGAVSSTCALLPPESPKTAIKVDSYAGVVESIVGRTGEGVHSVELWQRSGKVFHHGDGGAIQTVFQVDPDELLMAVMQDFLLENVLGSSLVFYTSKARILAISGSEARTRRRFAAPAGRQITGMQFDGHQLVGVFLEKVGQEGSVECISGRVGSAVDSCVIKLRDGTTYSYGEPGGDMIRGPWQIEPDEWIIVVEQFFRDRKLGASLAFYTSNGRVFKLSGMTAVKSPRFAAPAGQQICDLRFEGNRLVEVVTCPSDLAKRLKGVEHGSKPRMANTVLA